MRALKCTTDLLKPPPVHRANLEKNYFTNRTDRYIVVKQHSAFTNYLQRLLSLVAEHSYKLSAVAASTPSSPTSAADTEEAASPSSEINSPTNSAYTLDWPATDSLSQSAKAAWAQKAGEQMHAFTAQTHLETAMTQEEQGESDTTIVPLLQMGPYRVQHETSAVPRLFSFLDGGASRTSASSPPLLDLTSGYFSLYAPYKALILACRNVAVRIITAAPQSNGFFMSRGISGYVADAYTRMQIKFWEELKRAGRARVPAAQEEKREQPTDAEVAPSVEIREWKKQDWTYHAKGFWLTPAGERLPQHTLIGSSNFGGRSARLDLECTLLVSTSSPKLQQRLHGEVETLRKDAKDVFDDAFIEKERGKMGRRNTLFVKLGTWLIRKML